MLGKQGVQLWAVMQVVRPDSDAASGRAGAYYPKREAGGGGQDTRAKLQEAADPVKELCRSWRKMCSLHRYLLTEGGRSLPGQDLP